MSYHDDPCGCKRLCGDDGDVDGPGVCRGLPSAPEPPPVEIELVDRRTGEVVASTRRQP